MATSYLKEYLLSQLCKLGIDWPPPKEEEKPVVVQQTLTEAGYTPLLPTDEIPVALLPGMLRLDKQSWLNALSIEATFSSDVEDGDLVYPVAAGVSGEFISNIAELRDAVWKPVNQVSGTASTDEDSPRIWGIAYKHVGRVMFGPVVFHQRFAFKTGDILYVGDSGEITTNNEGAVLGVCLAPGSIFIDLSVTSSKLALDALQERVDKLEQGQEEAGGSISDLTEEIKDIQDELNQKLENGDNISNSTVTASGSTIARPLKDRFADVINVKDFGAVGDGVTDDTEAIRASYQFVVSRGGGAIFFPSGKYYVTSPIDIYRPSTDDDWNKDYIEIVLIGESLQTTSIIAGFENPAHAVFESIPPSGSTKRSSPVSVYNISFYTDDKINQQKAPGHLWVYGHGNSFLENVFFSGGFNTHFRSLAAQNVRLTNVTSWYGGHCWSYKNTAGVTGSVASDGTLTVSTAIFTQDDVGRTITVSASESGISMRKFTISQYVSKTSVKVKEGTGAFDVTGILFETASCHINAGSRTLIANCDCFSQDDVGRVIFIQRGKSDSSGNASLRTVITQFVSARVVYIADAPDEAIDGSFQSAAVEFASNEGLTGEDSSDVKMSMLHIEHYAGTGLILKNCNSYNIINAKIHGKTAPVYGYQSAYGVWIDNFSGDFCCDFDTRCSSNESVIYACRQKLVATFRDAHIHLVSNEKLLFEEPYSGQGAIVFDGIYTYADTRTIADMLDSGSAVVNGVVCSAYKKDTKSYLGNGVYSDYDGLHTDDLRIKSLSPFIELEVSGQKKWQILLQNTNLYIKDITKGVNRLCIHTETGNVYPPSSNTSSLGQANGLWSQLFASSDTINTSDQNEKQSIEAYPDAVLDAWGEVELRQFLFKDAVKKKGEAARIHGGVIAQQVVKVFEKHGLDATRYGLLCYDKWGDEYEDVEVEDEPPVLDADGNEVAPAKTHTEKHLVTAAGDRYGIRYSEALCLEAAYQRRRASRLEARVAALETALQNLNPTSSPKEEPSNV